MPIINAVHTTYDSVYLPVPVEASFQSSTWSWDTAHRFIVSNISVKQEVVLDNNQNIVKGDPRGTIWTVGDTVWNIDVSIPFLIPLEEYQQSPIQSFSEDPLTEDVFVESIFPDTTQGPYCANLPVIDNKAFPIQQFLASIIQPKIGLSTGTTAEFGMWETFWGTSNDNMDIITKELSVRINEEEASLDLKFICTKDPRDKLQIKQDITINTPMRSASFYDFSIPIGENI